MGEFVFEGVFAVVKCGHTGVSNKVILAPKYAIRRDGAQALMARLATMSPLP
jgi:hypothetical protein